MKVFVAGATGVLGHRAVAQLVAAGHQVSGVARSPEKAALLTRLGATPVTVDLFDADAVRDAVAGHDVVCNLATHIPPLSRTVSPKAWEENDRVRTEGSRILVDAAIAAGARRYVQESICFIYDDGGDRWLDEDEPFGHSPFGVSVLAAEANAARFTAAGGTGVVLRFAMFYGDDSSQTRTQVRAARQGVAPALGRPDAFQTMVHVDDAAAAVVAALDAPAGVYNVAEDRPTTRAGQAAAVAHALGVAAPWYPPTLPGMGPKFDTLMRSERVSNARFRAATGWAPRYPDPTSGWAQVIKALDLPDSTSGRRLLVRAGLAFLAFQGAVLGVWATFFPRSFYDSFPGGGRHWVALDGPYNHHLVGDVGALSLAVCLVTVVALFGTSRAMTRTAGAAWVVSQVPHFVYHATHRGVLGTGDFVASLTGLGILIVVGAVVAVVAPATPAASPPNDPAPALQPAISAA